jgi:alanyl-tRNA synthetase
MLKNSKLLFFLIPVMVVLLGIAFYDCVYLEIRSETQTLDELKQTKQKTLEKYISTIGQKEDLEKQISVLRESRKKRETTLLDGQTSSVAAANLQSIVKEIISSKGGNLSSEKAEKPEDLGQLKVITVGVDAILPEVRVLYETLHQLETHPVTLVVRELDIRVRNIRDPKELIVKFSISALNRGNGR